MKRLMIAVSILVITLSFTIAVQGQTSNVYIHTVGSGQTLGAIATLYNIDVTTLKEANKLASDGLYIGQKLLIPLARPLTVHTVVNGESLLGIARRYGTIALYIAWANNLSNPSLIYIGQKLVIPPVRLQITPTSKATARPATTPPSVQEAIIITSPVLNSRITSPVTITGWGSGYENTLAVAILDETGKKIGTGYVTINAEFGQYGPFSGVVTFTAPAKAQVCKVQVFSISARDGSIDHLNSVMVKYQP
jgi:LysM repeat protein